MKKYTQQTLQPCMESYGLQPTRVTAVTNQGSSVTFELASDSSAHQTTSEPLEDKTATVLFLLDQYGVSDSFYHELAQAWSKKCKSTCIETHIHVS